MNKTHNSTIRYETPKKIVFLKGFVHGVNWESNKHQAIIQEVLKNVKNHNIVVWDGDLYKKDSFTFVLGEIIKQYSTKEYIAYKKQKHAYKLNPNYRNSNHGINVTGYKINKLKVIQLSDNLSYTSLGKEALINILTKNPNAKINILFLGQGQVAENEEKYIKTLIPENPNRISIKKYYVNRSV